jgi:hypothetical protein
VPTRGWIPSDGSGSYDEHLPRWHDGRLVKARERNATKLLAENGFESNGLPPRGSRKSVAAPTGAELGEAVTGLPVETEAPEELHEAIERVNRETRKRTREAQRLWSKWHVGKDSAPVLGRVPIPKGGFEPGELAEHLSLDGVAASHQRKELAGRRRDELAQLAWYAWRRRTHFGITTKAQLAARLGEPATTIRSILNRKEAQLDRDAIIEAVRAEGEKTRHELTMVLVRERDGEAPAEAMDRHLAELSPPVVSDEEVDRLAKPHG